MSHNMRMKKVIAGVQGWYALLAIGLFFFAGVAAATTTINHQFT